MTEGTVSGNSSSSKSLMWMTAALFAAMAVLLTGGFFLAARVLRSLGIRASLGGATMQVQTREGTYRLERENQVGPAVPMYPGASLVIPEDESTAQDVKDAENGISRVVYQTEDSRDAVDKWYQDHLPQAFERHDTETPRTANLKTARVADTDIAYEATKNGHTRVVTLSEDPGGTKITIVRLDQPQPNDADPGAAPAPAQP